MAARPHKPDYHFEACYSNMTLVCMTTDGDSIRAWEAVERLSRRDWWTRAWIIQEAPCSVTTTLHYGAYSVLLIEAYAAVLLLMWLGVFHESMSSIKAGRYGRCMRLMAIGRPSRRKCQDGSTARRIEADFPTFAMS